VVNHIRVKRMWKYVHFELELTLEEQAHVCECRNCLMLLKICVLADPGVTPAIELQEDDFGNQSHKKSA